MSLQSYRATVEHWRRIKDLRLAGLAEAPEAFGSTLQGEQDRPDEFWIARLSVAEVETIVVTLDGVDAGLCVVAPTDEPGIAALYGVWVRPMARGRGVGDALMAAAIESARRRGNRRLILDVGDDNVAAIGLYQRAGFLRTGRTTTMPAPREHMTEHERAVDLQSGGP